MSELLDFALQAHGGLERWRECVANIIGCYRPLAPGAGSEPEPGGPAGCPEPPRPELGQSLGPSLTVSPLYFR